MTLTLASMDQMFTSQQWMFGPEKAKENRHSAEMKNSNDLMLFGLLASQGGRKWARAVHLTCQECCASENVARLLSLFLHQPSILSAELQYGCPGQDQLQIEGSPLEASQVCHIVGVSILVNRCTWSASSENNTFCESGCTVIQFQENQDLHRAKVISSYMSWSVCAFRNMR